MFFDFIGKPKEMWYKMKNSTIVIGSFSLFLLSLIIVFILVIENINDDNIIKQQKEELLRNNISFSDDLDIFNDKLADYKTNIDNLSSALINAEEKYKQDIKDINNNILSNYNKNINNTLCNLRRAQCLDELRDVKLNLSKTLEMYYELRNETGWKNQILEN